MKKRKNDNSSWSQAGALRTKGLDQPRGDDPHFSLLTARVRTRLRKTRDRLVTLH